MGLMKAYHRQHEDYPAITLRPRTWNLLMQMDTPRREMINTGRKGADGFWIFSRPRTRSIAHLDRIVKFKRCPAAVREVVQRQIDSLLGEARYFEQRYGDARW